MNTITSNSSVQSQGPPDQRQAAPVARGHLPLAPVTPVTPSRPVNEVQAAVAARPAAPKLTTEDAKRVAEELQRRTSIAAPELHFSVDQSTGRSVIKVLDRRTKEVIRQIPAEEILQIDKGLDRFEQGLLLNRKV